MVLRQRRVAVNAEHALEKLASELRRVDRVDRLGHDRNAGELADRVGRAQELVARARLAVLEAFHLRPQHEVREIDVPRMRRHVRALRHVAHVAEVAVLDDLPVRRSRNTVELAARRIVDRVEQCRKRVAQAEAAPATVADVEHARELRVQRLVLGELGRAPLDRVARRRIEAALAARRFAIGHGRSLLESRTASGPAARSEGISLPNRPTLSGSGSRANARPSRASRTNRRSPRSPRPVPPSPCRDTCRCTRAFRRRSRP